MTDPFEQLAAPTEPRAPRSEFALELRTRLIDALGLDGSTGADRLTIAIDVPVIDHEGTMNVTSRPTSPSSPGPTTPPADDQPYVDGIWSVVAYADPEAGIRFVTDVLGFTEQVLVQDDHGEIIHSEYRWPEGGVVQVVGVQPDNPFAPEPGHNGGVYVVTRDPHAVWERCRDADGVEVIRAPEEPHYDPGGMGFAIRDPEGNIWSFGSYAGGSTG